MMGGGGERSLRTVPWASLSGRQGAEDSAEVERFPESALGTSCREVL